jgi:hypothetical protein
MPSFYLNSYDPLVSSEYGRQASERHCILPFVDGSIRREPDLEHRYPAISCLCRGRNFAPRLREGDVVAYVTNKGTFGNGRERRLTAVLQVKHLFASHPDAAAWYIARGLPLPNNCMVPGNRSKPLRESHRRKPKRPGCGGGCNGWDASYRLRARRWGSFVVCRKMWRELGWDAPVVRDENLLDAFGRIPGFRNPGEMSMDDLQSFLAVMGLELAIPNV